MSNNRGKKLAFNTVSSLMLQVVTVICGFILPRLIIGTYGSNVNGLVSSIAKFLGVVTLLDLGVGTVVQSALYKPLAENDHDIVSKIFVSANRFFKRIAAILLIYVVILFFTYPIIVNRKFGFLYTGMLILAICINRFSQYYFGIVNSLLLGADQKGYIQYTAQIVTLIVNTIVCAILIKNGASIQIVKFATSLIFLFRPLFLYYYVKKRYVINRKITYTEEPIKQKWNGMAQHFASYVLTGTDPIVLTIFSTLANVSIYSIYDQIANGVFMLITAISNGFFSYFGDMWAKNEKDRLKNDFSTFEWLMHLISVMIFGCTSMVILDFVRVYSSGIVEAEHVEYVQPLFSLIFVLAYFARCLRLPYNYIILAAGHYKQTQSSYYVSMIMNIVISIATVNLFGLVGVAIGTLCAMLYQTIWMAVYVYRNLIKNSMIKFIKHMIIDMVIGAIGFLCCFKINLDVSGYFKWGIEALIIFAIWAGVSVLINFIFYKDEFKRILLLLKRKVKVI